eukprot:CAMPEP_0119135384 /NCGR_PEP_ID=MMETSP1310-20130426/19171_1 /TAXON_ID=464262 /ORGANISM="Genus nov. species nov., Strain RCC2339" /LENGTH=361 /DNA_ID=CAMNT_0007126261 /DNA_START=293 /DNA_END=1374 /DNA_ORIENTATION=-
MQNAFKGGTVDDAAEALEAILTCLDAELRPPSHEKAEGKVRTQPTFTQTVFEFSVLEYVKCDSCHVMSPPILVNFYTYYTYATALAAAKSHSPQLSFGALLHSVSEGDYRSCPNEDTCERKLPINKYLCSLPAVMIVGMVWESARSSPSEILSVLDIIEFEINLRDVFPAFPHDQTRYRLRGMVCYYGMHYDAYFIHPTRRQWWVFNDEMVRRMGDSWLSVKEKCLRGRCQPSVLFYERVTEAVPIPPPPFAQRRPPGRAAGAPGTQAKSTDPPPQYGAKVRPPAYGQQPRAGAAKGAGPPARTGGHQTAAAAGDKKGAQSESRRGDPPSEPQGKALPQSGAPSADAPPPYTGRSAGAGKS